MARALAACRGVAATRLLIPKGVYRFSTTAGLDVQVVKTPGKDYIFSNRSGFRLEWLTNLEIDGQGSEFLFCFPRGEAKSLIEISHCHRVALRALTVDWDWQKDPLASAARILAVDPEGRSLDLDFFDRSIPAPAEAHVGQIKGLHPGSGKPGFEDGLHLQEPALRAVWLRDRVLRIEMKPGVQASVKRQANVGGKVRISHYYYETRGFFMVTNTHLTFSNVSLYSCPGMGFVLHDAHGVAFQAVRLVPRPGTTRTLTAAADGLHAADNITDLLMERCQFSLNGDDLININDHTIFGVKTGEREVEVFNASENAGKLAAGQRLSVRRDDFTPTDFTATYSGRVFVGPGHYRLQFKEVFPSTLGSNVVLFVQERASRNVLIRDCDFDQGGRLLLQCPDLTFESNRLSDCGWLHLTSGYCPWWCEGSGIQNAVIRGNTFEEINVRGSMPLLRAVGGVNVDVYLGNDPSKRKTDFPLHRDILIEGNRFDNPAGVALIFSSASNVWVRGNRFRVTAPRPSDRDDRGALFAQKTYGLSVVGNEWVRSTYLRQPGAWLETGSVREFHFESNRATGPAWAPRPSLKEVPVEALPEALSGVVSRLSNGGPRLSGGQYAFFSVPKSLEQGTLVTVGRGSKSEPGSPWQLRLPVKAVGFLFIHERGNVVTPPGWELTSLRAEWAIGPYRFADRIYKKRLEPGPIEVPAHEWRDPSGYGIPSALVLLPDEGP